MYQRFSTRISLIAICFFIAFTANAQLAAQFNASPISGCAPLVVSFQDQSTGNPTQWKWDLGNSTISYLQNPVSTFFNPGQYSVKLVVQNAAGKDSITKTQYITVYATPNVNFSVNQSMGCFPLPVQFTNTSTAGSGTITGYLWDFGDGNTSTTASPTHIYTGSGAYNVSLMITNSNGCTKTLTRNNYINVSGGVQAAFTNDAPISCSLPQPIQFQNQTTGGGTLSYQWDFGDGSTSTLANPTHNYTATGAYTVRLIAVNSNGCRDTAIHVSGVTIQTVQANFTMPASICAGSPISFTNGSTPAPVSTIWTFGDGTTSTALNPIKTFALPGNYSVKLVSDFGPCKDSITKNVQVFANPVTAFTGNPLVSCNAPLTVNFSNSSSAGNSYYWNFGDGSNSTLTSPSHTYTTTGFYTVTLITTNASGCKDTLVKTDYVKIQPPLVSFNNLPQQGCAPFTWTFGATVTSVDPVVSYLWNFGDGSSSTAINPTHVFPAGVYDIQLIITTAVGCKDTITRTAGIRSSIKPVANFSATPREVCAFSPVNFTDLSTGSINQWQWFFGDGDNSASQHPTHNYGDTGLFTVTLIVGNYGCYDTIVFPDYIRVLPPIAIFDVAMDCAQPFIRTFTDNSIGADEWNWNFGDGNSSNLPSPVHNYAVAGTYTVSLTVRNIITGCEHTTTRPVIVADEQAVFAATDTILCRGESTTFNAQQNNTGGIVTYEWNFGDGTTGTGNPVSHVYPLAGLYTVSLIITDAVGCKDTATKINYIRVNGPTADFNPSVPGTCLQSSINFNDLSTTDGTNAITNWYWNYGDGLSDTLSAPPFSHVYASPGTYSVSLMVKDAAGCTDSIYKNNILTISSPVASFNASDTLSCPQSAIIFHNSSTGPGLSFLWNFGDGSTSTLTTPTHAYAANGIYTVQLDITDSYGCTDRLIRTQYIHIVTPVAGFTVSDSVSTCPPLIVQFTNTSVNQATYNWDFGDGTFSSSISPSHFYNEAGVYTARLSITGPGGCTDVKTKTITVRGPRGSFTYTNIRGCKPLTVNFIGTTQDRTSFIWDFNDGTTIATNDSIISHTYTIAGSYIPKMILKDAAGCTVPITGPDTIIVSGVNAAFIADTMILCSNGYVNFTNNSVGNDVISNYLWDFGDGSSSTLTSPTHYYAAEGNYTVKLKATTAMGCIDSVSSISPVRVVKKPSINITQPANGCIPLSRSFTGNLLNADTSAIQWQWTLSDGRNATGRITNPFLFSTAGNYNATLIATNSSGCKDTAQTSLQAYALPVVNAGNDITICLGTGQSLTASGASTYSWSPSTGLSCTNCASPVANPATEMVYHVTGLSAQGCANKDSVKVSVQMPFKMQPGKPDTICIGKSVTLTISGADAYAWSPSAGLNNTNTSTVRATPVTTTNYRVIGSDNKGCFKDTAYFPVKVYPIPTVNAGSDKTINVGQTITLTPTISADVTKVTWNPTGGIFRSSFPSVDVKPNQPTKYTVEVSNPGGCTAKDDLMVHVLCNGANVFIPNTFSPNGDGVNEIFYPRGSGLFLIKTARIFNRWGELVFEKYNMKANELNSGWDGTFRGQKLASDVYVYVFEIICDNDAVLLYKGDIALIR